MPDTDVVEITQPVEFCIAGDRLQFTVTSGQRQRTYSLSFNKARGACHLAMRMLDERDRKQSDRVRAIKAVQG